MATAEELLATVGNEENYIVIDSDLRTMTFPASVKNIGVENDKDVHKLNFMMPRYFSEYDLSTFNIRINYLNAQGDGDMYVVTDPTVEDNAIYFSWLVGRHACLYRGAVTFIVCLKLADGEGDVAQEFNTTLASLQVLPGLETEPTILETDYDIIEQLLLTIQDTNGKIKAVLDSGMTAEELGNIAKEQKTLKSRMDEFASLPDGSTAGDAELTDIRVGADGTVYGNAGDAVRTQVADLKEDLQSYYNIDNYEFEYGGIYKGTDTVDTKRIRTKEKIIVYKDMHIKFSGIYGGLFVESYNLDGTWREGGSWTQDFTVTQDGYVRIVLRKRYDAEIEETDFDTLIGSTKLLYHFNYVYEKLLTDLDDISSDISYAKEKADLPLLTKYTQQTETGYAIKNNVAIGATVDLTPVEVANLASIVIKHIPKGMKFRVFGTSTYYYLYYSWLDKDAKLLEKPEAWSSSEQYGTLITAPDDDCILVCSSNASYTYGFYVESPFSVVNLYNSLVNSDAIVEQKKNVRNNLLGGATADFVFFSDIHGSATNFNRIIDYAKENSVDAIINGGDTILRYLNDADHPMTWYTDGITASSVDILSAVGNHDVWDGAYWTKANAVDVYNAFISPIIAKYSGIVQPSGASTNGLCYYYKDYDAARVIVLNAMAGDGSVNFWDTTQANWLTSVLNDAKTNSKHVLIVNHAPFQKTIAVRDERLHWNTYLDYTDLSTYDGIHTTPDAVQLVKNFIDSGGAFIGWLTGHLHSDNVITATGFDKQMMFNIATANNAFHNDGVSYTGVSSQYYDCFNHIAVDTVKGLVKMIRVGWNTDYSIKTREELCYDYINGKLLTDN